ncbi:MAG: phosphotransferase [Candidatus Zipacnadales bacterium]
MSSILTLDQLATGLRAYSLGEVRSLVSLGEGHTHYPHCVQTDRGTYFLKILSGRLAAPSVLQMRHAFLAHLSHCGIPVPIPLHTEAGTTWMVMSVGTLEVYKWIEGEPLNAASVDHAIQAARLLCDLHRAAEHFQPPLPNTKYDSLGADDDIAKLEFMEQQICTYMPAPEIIEQVRWVKQSLLAAERTLEQVDLPTHMIHGDFQRENLLLAADGTLWVTDFDECRVAPRVFDWALLAIDFERGYDMWRMFGGEECHAFKAAYTRLLIRRELKRGSTVEYIAQLLDAIGCDPLFDETH